ncbi:MAG: thiamine-phosphate kinase [Acidobacteriota bacterium]
MMEEILENRRISLLTRNFEKPPHRLNSLHESDAELVDMGDSSAYYLAATADALIEEVESGLYDDPNFIGWMLATANFSDLAAVGADPLGLLVTVSYASAQDETYLPRLAAGIHEACRALGTFVLGGDTNQGEHLSLAGCALGLVPRDEVVTRVGARPGDRIYLTGPAGLGAVYAFLRLGGQVAASASSFFKPMARINEGRLVRRFASCAMDTSDGLIHALDTLMRLNRCHFAIEDRWTEILHPLVIKVCQAQGIPPWLALAAVHGEFEVCFTVRPSREQAFLTAARTAGWFPIAVGRVAEGEGVSIQANGKCVLLDTTLIRNIAAEAGADPKAYIGKLFKIAQEVGV